MLAAAAVAGPAKAGGGEPGALPWADASQVNVAIAGDQETPAVAAGAGGRWIVVWRDLGPSGTALRSRALTRGGPPLTGEAEIVSDSLLGAPEIAALDDGRFVVVWSTVSPNLGEAAEGLELGVQGRFLDAVGLPTGGVLQLHETSQPPFRVDVASAPGGGFVATWEEDGAVRVRRYSATGLPIGALLSANTIGVGASPRIARLERGGGHLLVWSSDTSAGDDDSGSSVQWRRLTAAGAFDGPERQANAFTAGSQASPDVAAALDGGFAVVWRSDPVGLAAGPTGDPDGLALRYFDRRGEPFGAEVGATSATSGQVAQPRLESGPDDGLVAVWRYQSDWPRARRFTGRSFVGDEIEVDTQVYEGSAGEPAVAIDEEGDFAVVWRTHGGSAGDDDDGASVQIRPYTAGRVAHWRLDQTAGTTASDGAGLVDDHAIVSPGGDPFWSWGRPGRGALEFGGAGHVAIDTSTELGIAGGAVSLAAWIYLETPPSQLGEAFASIYDAEQDAYVLYLDRAAAELRFKVTTSNGVAERPGIPEAQLPLQRWIHVVGVYRGGAAQIWLDGALADQHANPNLFGPVRSNPPQLAALGRDGALDRYLFDGRIDEIEVWRRSLELPEIRDLRGRYLFGDGFESGGTAPWSAAVP